MPKPQFLMNNLAIYIHWPFCKAKCPYCDFNSHVASVIDHDEWRRAYVQSAGYFADYIKRHNISSIFFGGGTPTLMEPETVATIIDYLRSITAFTPDIEITLEGNPTSVEAEKLAAFRDAGINRISLGVQSLVEKDLKFLGREHSTGEAMQAVEAARKIFDNYSFDLIYARPGQSLREWEAELSLALQFAGNHLSLYQLTIEKGTRFFSDYSRGKFTIPDEDLAADFYLLTRQVMEAHGIPAYEVSNHARAGFESRHNMSYWRYDDYLGIGPGAHSRITIDNGKHALMMTNMPEKWLAGVAGDDNGVQTNMLLSKQDVIYEVMAMGLRTVEGITKDRFRKITGHDIGAIIKPEKLEKLLANNMVEFDADGLRCTKQGVLIMNYIAAELV